MCQNVKDRKYYLTVRQRKIAQANTYRKTHKDTYNAYRRSYRKMKEATDPNYKISRRLRKRLWDALRGRPYFPSSLAIKHLGCTVSELWDHLQLGFTPGMTRENYGEWHVDHIKPLVKFNLNDPAQLAEACHYSNLQPLWAAENCRKRDT